MSQTLYDAIRETLKPRIELKGTFALAAVHTQVLDRGEIAVCLNMLPFAESLVIFRKEG